VPTSAAASKWKTVSVLSVILAALSLFASIGFAAYRAMHPPADPLQSAAWLGDAIQLFSLSVLFVAGTSIAQRLSRSAH
jgi:hypothetical protein